MTPRFLILIHKKHRLPESMAEIADDPDNPRLPLIWEWWRGRNGEGGGVGFRAGFLMSI